MSSPRRTKKLRADYAETRRRVHEVLEMRLLGAELHDIKAHAQDPDGDGDPAKAWNVSERQLWRYIAAADKAMTARLEKEKDKLFARHIAQRRSLFARCMASSDYSNARALLADEAKLLDLYPSEKHDVNVKKPGVLILGGVDLNAALGTSPPE